MILCAGGRVNGARREGFTCRVREDLLLRALMPAVPAPRGEGWGEFPEFASPYVLVIAIVLVIVLEIQASIFHSVSDRQV